MKIVTVHLEDGSEYQTKANGSPDFIRGYFVGELFNVGVNKDRLLKCVSIDIKEEEVTGHDRDIH